MTPSTRPCPATAMVGSWSLLGERSIGGDEALDAAGHQHLRIGLQKLRVVSVNHGQKEEVVFSQIFFDAANDQGSVRVADLFSDHADGVGALKAQRTGEIVGSIIEVFGGLKDAFFSALGNGACSRRSCSAQQKPCRA